MRQAEARMVAESSFDAGLDQMMDEFWRLQRTLPVDAYFQALDKFIDQAKSRLNTVKDPHEKNRLREQYSQVITSAVNLACGINS